MSDMTIRALLLQLQQTHDLGVLPILADALLGAGYPESEAAWMRAWSVRYYDGSDESGWPPCWISRHDETTVAPRMQTPYLTSDKAAEAIAEAVHERLTAPCCECDGDGWHCSPLMTRAKCGHCVGLGWIVKPPVHRRTCPRCDGHGRATFGGAIITDRDWTGWRSECPVCNGTGNVEEPT